MTAAEADRLARENLWRCSYLARQMTRSRPWLKAEAESVGLLGLAQALHNFDPDRGPFAPHARRCVWRAIGVYLHLGEVAKGYRRRPGLPQPVRPNVVAVSTLGTESGTLDREAGGPAVGHTIEWEDQVEALGRLLPPRHAIVFRLRQRHCEMQAVADALGLHRTYTYHVYTEALEMLRRSPVARRMLSA